MTLSQKMCCPICNQKQEVVQEFPLIYATKHPLFASCRLVSCISCKSAWVCNPPDRHALNKYYDEEEAYGKGSFLRLLKKPSISLERCQAFARWNFIQKTLKTSPHDFMQKTFSVCDIGAGFGCTYEVAKYQKWPIRYFAFESSLSMRRHILSLGGEVLSDFFQYEPTKQFDLVWASHILEHYPNPDDLLEKMRQMIKLDGAGFIEIPCLDYEFKEELAPHLLFFTLIGLQRALVRNGFEILRADTVGCLRCNAKDYFQERASPLSFPQRLKKIFSMGRVLEEDVSQTSIFDKWGLEVYGGERSWIRAVFKKIGD